MDTYWLEMYAKVKMYEWVCGTVFGVVLFSLYIIIKILESGLTKRAPDVRQARLFLDGSPCLPLVTQAVSRLPSQILPLDKSNDLHII